MTGSHKCVAEWLEAGLLNLDCSGLNSDYATQLCDLGQVSWPLVSLFLSAK